MSDVNVLQILSKNFPILISADTEFLNQLWIYTKEFVTTALISGQRFPDSRASLFRLGRWWRLKEAKNGIYIIPLKRKPSTPEEVKVAEWVEPNTLQMFKFTAQIFLNKHMRHNFLLKLFFQHFFLHLPKNNNSCRSSTY